MESSTHTPAPRTKLFLEVSFRKNYAREESKGTLHNISVSGAFLQADGIDFIPREKLQLKFIVSGRERKVQAQVVWKNHVGYGIKFLPLNNRDVQIVDDLIYFVESQRSTRLNVLDNIFKKVG